MSAIIVAIIQDMVLHMENKNLDSVDFIFDKNFEQKTESKNLCILIHGYGKLLPWKNSHNKLKDLKEVIEESFADDMDIYYPNLNKEMIFYSINNPNNIVKDLLEDINRIWTNKTYDKIYIIGYSTGALIARKLYVCACGNNPEAPLEEKFKGCNLPTQWADAIDRIILLAGINRGWSINHHLSLMKAISWTIVAGLGNLMMLFSFNKLKPLLFNIRKGAFFITQLRIQWIYMRRKVNSDENKIGNALTIQLLGTKDDLVSPEDNIDLVSGKDFVYMEVPFSNHLNVVEMLPDHKNIDKNFEREKRKDKFLFALTGKKNELKQQSQQVITNIEPFTLSHKLLTKKKDEITDVVFVIHGIRDEGHWTNKIAQRVILENEEANEKRWKKDKRHFAIETSRYGYFPMLLFALPWTRRAKVAWFMDQYAENLVLYPKAEFSFIGHSNGTYLVAQALKEYQCCKFNRIVFAGSVVPKEYDWYQYTHREKRVKLVLNYVATFDWVVAIFPNFLHFIQRDLGSAGHDGFKAGFNINKKREQKPKIVLKIILLFRRFARKLRNKLSSRFHICKRIKKSFRVGNIKYVKGQHGAALNEYNWDVIAKFIVYDSPTFPKVEDLKIPKITQDKRTNILSIIGKFPLIAWIILILILGGIGVLIWLLASHLGERLQTLIFMLYLGLIWTVLTRI